MIDHDIHDDDTPLEPRLAELARDYNRPPAAPREAMWARIEAARRAERGAVAASVPATTPATVGTTRDSVVVSIDAARSRRRSARPWAFVAAGLAAGLLFGVAVERFRRGEVVEGNGGPSIAVTTPVAPNAAAPESGAVQATMPDESIAPASPSATVARRDSGATPRPVAPRTPRVAAPEAPRFAQREPRTSVPAGTRDASQALYRAAAVQTLTQAEAVLVAYRAGTLDTAQASQLGRWARDVLSSTRLLIDSPAARDPELQRLLGDLELLLAQLVQLSGSRLTPDERELIDQGLRARDLLPRIRSAVPAGTAASTE